MVALVAVSKTIELAGQPSPLYRRENKYQLVIEWISFLILPSVCPQSNVILNGAKNILKNYFI